MTTIERIILAIPRADLTLAQRDAVAEAGRVDLDRALGIVVGHEGEGLRRLVRDRCDFLVRPPMRGRVESLNAAVAGSILLYAAWQARGFNQER